MIKTMGKESFEKSPYKDEYKTINPPLSFLYLFNIFIELYNNSKEGCITWNDIYSYCQLKKIQLHQWEISLIIKCKGWANSEISILKEGD